MTEAPPSTRFLFVEAFPEALRDDCSADLFVLCLNIFSGSQRCDPGDGKIRARWARAKKEADANGAGSCRRQWRRNWGVRPRGQRRILTAITATKNSATLVVTEAKNSVVSHSLRALQAWRVGEVSALTAARWRVSVVRLCLVFVRSLALPPCPANPPGAVDVVFVPRALQGIMTTTTARGTPRPATPGTVIITTTVPNLVFVRSLALPPSPAIPRGLLTAFSGCRLQVSRPSSGRLGCGPSLRRTCLLLPLAFRRRCHLSSAGLGIRLCHYQVFARVLRPLRAPLSTND